VFGRRVAIPSFFWLLLAVAVLVGILALFWSRPIGEPPRNGLPLKISNSPQPVYPVAIGEKSGRTFDLKDLRGKIVLLNLWATWCPPCVQEMPSLDRLQAELGGSDFEVIALSVDTGADALQKIRSFYAEKRIERLKIYRDIEGVAIFKLKAVGIPTTLLLDRNGLEIGRMSGTAEWDSPEIVAELRKLVEARN